MFLLYHHFMVPSTHLILIVKQVSTKSIRLEFFTSQNVELEMSEVVCPSSSSPEAPLSGSIESVLENLHTPPSLPHLDSDL